ncbi:MAG TPA: hypothetical protein DCF63_07845 [Planctomycetaceae bacterium]|nr:hypothetical protein [Planctomycetaceae bacterium]
MGRGLAFIGQRGQLEKLFDHRHDQPQDWEMNGVQSDCELYSLPTALVHSSESNYSQNHRYFLAQRFPHNPPVRH